MSLWESVCFSHNNQDNISTQCSSQKPRNQPPHSPALSPIQPPLLLLEKTSVVPTQVFRGHLYFLCLLHSALLHSFPQLKSSHASCLSGPKDSTHLISQPCLPLFLSLMCGHVLTSAPSLAPRHSCLACLPTQQTSQEKSLRDWDFLFVFSRFV